MWLRSGMVVAVAVAQAGSCSSNSTPSLRTSLCRGCSPPPKKKKRHRARAEPNTGWLWRPCFAVSGSLDSVELMGTLRGSYTEDAPELKDSDEAITSGQG